MPHVSETASVGVAEIDDVKAATQRRNALKRKTPCFYIPNNVPYGYGYAMLGRTYPGDVERLACAAS